MVRLMPTQTDRRSILFIPLCERIKTELAQVVPKIKSKYVENKEDKRPIEKIINIIGNTISNTIKE